MYILKIDIVEKNLLTRTYYSGNSYSTIESARFSAWETRKRLFKNLAAGEIKGYTVDIVPAN